MANIGIFFGSSTGNTEDVADKLQALFGEENAEVINVDIAEVDDVNRFQFLILGTSTWGIGDMQDDWEEFVGTLLKADLKSKKVALFGLGDQEVYTESFVDGMGALYNKIKNKTSVVGFWPTEGYRFEDSIAIVDDKFVGLVLDEDNQKSKTNERLTKWVEILKKEFN